jgi:hypothetical protein
MTRGLSIDKPGTAAGLDPVAMIACSKVSVSGPPFPAPEDAPTGSMLSVLLSRNDARPWM